MFKGGTLFKQRFWVLLVLILVLTMSAAAARFEIEVEQIKDELYPGEVALYIIHIENKGPDADELKYEFVDDPSWSIITNPTFHQTSLKIQPGEKKKTTISITPDKSIEYGQKYDYTFMVVSKLNNAEESVVLTLFLKSPYRLKDYVPIVDIDVDVDSEIDPRNEITLSMEITNRNQLNISRLSIEVTSKINPENNRLLEIPLEGLEKKEMELTFKYDPLQKPAKEEVTVVLSVPDKNKTFNPKTKQIQILPYNEIHRETVQKDYFLKNVKQITIFNDGNVNKLEDIRIRTSLFNQIFTSEHPKAEVIKEGGFRYLSWPTVLAPQESKTIAITVNYRPLFIVFIVMIVAIALYRIFRSPLIIKKEAHKIKNAENDEESSKIKIQIHVKNRTGKIIENLNIIDRIPHIVVLDKDFPVGTLQPSKVIKHEKKGTIIKWVIPTLEAYEERIITYNLRSKLKIIGGLKLSSAMLKYKNRLNKFSKAYSNRAYAH